MVISQKENSSSKLAWSNAVLGSIKVFPCDPGVKYLQKKHLGTKLEKDQGVNPATTRVSVSKWS